MDSPYRPVCKPCYQCFDASWIPTTTTWYTNIDGLIVAVFACLVMPAALFSFWAFRELPRIKSRSPFLTVVGGLAQFLVVLSYSLERYVRSTWGVNIDSHGYHGFPCVWSSLSLFCFVMAYILSYPLRGVRIIYVFRKTVFPCLARRAAAVKREAIMPGSVEDRRSQSLTKFDLVKKSSSSSLPPPSSSSSSPRSAIVSVPSRAKMVAMYVIDVFRPGPGITEGKLFAGLAVFLIIIDSILLSSGGPRVNLCNDCDFRATAYLFPMGLYVVIILFLGVTLVLLRNVRDEWTINTELRFNMVVIVAFLAPWAVLSFLGNKSFPHNYLMVVGAFISFFSSIILPLERAVSSTGGLTREEYQRLAQDIKDNEVGTTIESILDNETAVEHFRRFLKAELCEENLAFYEAARKYRAFCNTKGVSIDKILAKAKEVFEEFLNDDAPMQVNFPWEKRKHATQTFETIKSGTGNSASALSILFVPLQEEVLHMMSLDSLPKFRNSPQFSSMRTEVCHTDIAAAEEAGYVNEAEKAFTDTMAFDDDDEFDDVGSSTTGGASTDGDASDSGNSEVSSSAPASNSLVDEGLKASRELAKSDKKKKKSKSKSKAKKAEEKAEKEKEEREKKKKEKEKNERSKSKGKRARSSLGVKQSIPSDSEDSAVESTTVLTAGLPPPVRTPPPY